MALAKSQDVHEAEEKGTLGDSVGKAVANVFRISFCKDRTSLGNSAASSGVQCVCVSLGECAMADGVQDWGPRGGLASHSPGNSPGKGTGLLEPQVLRRLSKPPSSSRESACANTWV